MNLAYALRKSQKYGSKLANNNNSRDLAKVTCWPSQLNSQHEVTRYFGQCILIMVSCGFGDNTIQSSDQKACLIHQANISKIITTLELLKNMNLSITLSVRWRRLRQLELFSGKKLIYVQQSVLELALSSLSRALLVDMSFFLGSYITFDA